MNAAHDGLVLLNKPAEITSFQALKPVKQRLKSGKVGHTGTLDRFAEGLLVAAVGFCSRFAPHVTALPKEYYAELQLGTETSTLDPEGAVTATGPIPKWETVLQAAERFRGEIMQTPPAYSAVKVRGKRAAQHTRAGQLPELRARPVTIYELDLLDYSAETGVLALRMLCSKGTYVRALARDLAAVAGSCAHVTKLRRDRIGAFALEAAVEPEAFEPHRDLLPPERFLPLLEGIGQLSVSPQTAERMQHGTPLGREFFSEVRERVHSDGLFAAFAENDRRFIALIERDQGRWRYQFVRAKDR